MKHLQSPSASRISDLRIPTSHFLQVGCSTLQLFLHSDFFLKLYTFPFPIFSLAGLFPWLPHPLWGDKSWHLAPPEPKLCPLTPSPFPSPGWAWPPAPSQPLQPGGSHGNSQGNLKREAQRAGFIRIWTRGGRAPWSSSLCREESPKFIFNKLLAICKLVSIPLFSGFGGQKLAWPQCWAGRNIFVYKFRRQLWPGLSFSSPLEHFSLKTSHLLNISHSIRTQWYYQRSACGGVVNCELRISWISCSWEFLILHIYILHSAF